MSRTLVSLFLPPLLVLSGLLGYSALSARPAQPPLETIAFGSCNDQDRPQPMWDLVRDHSPDLWMWLGDNIYADTGNIAVLESLYAVQRRQPGYAALRRTTPVIGTWDDHDYGQNDGGRTFAHRDASQRAFLNFLDVPEDDTRRLRRGVYSAHTYGPPGRRVKVILLDTRYHRDPLTPDSTSKARYRPNPTGDVLGNAQWTWLEDELRSSDAQVHLIGTSIQAVPTQHRFEKWSNFPAARERLFEVLRRTEAPGVILLSGDRHKAELSRLDGALDYPLYELTSSGLTHSAPYPNEPNRHRLGTLFVQKNVGFVRFNWPARTFTLEVRSVKDEPVIQHTVSLDSLRGR